MIRQKDTTSNFLSYKTGIQVNFVTSYSTVGVYCNDGMSQTMKSVVLQVSRLAELVHVSAKVALKYSSIL